MDKKKQTVEPGKFVAFSYKLYDDADNSLLFDTEKQPDVMVFGVSHEIVPGLADTLKGLSEGDRFGVTLPPVLAFGDWNSEYLLELDPQIFMRDGQLAKEVKVGAHLPMMTAEGFKVEGIVKEIGDKIKMDFNHPFAGKTVRYDGEVVEVRDATPEELAPISGCGGGCGGGCNSGCCSEGSCENGCCQ